MRSSILPHQAFCQVLYYILLSIWLQTAEFEAKFGKSKIIFVVVTFFRQQF